MTKKGHQKFSALKRRSFEKFSVPQNSAPSLRLWNEDRFGSNYATNGPALLSALRSSLRVSIFSGPSLAFLCPQNLFLLLDTHWKHYYQVTSAAVSDAIKVTNCIT